MIKSMQEILDKAADIKTKTVAVACAADVEVLEAIEKARKLNIVNAILVGTESEIVALLKKVDGNANDYQIIDESDPAEASRISVELVVDGKADMVMKGLVDSSVILRAVLNKEKGLRTGSLLSHATAFEIPGQKKIYYMTDGAFNVSPTAEDKKQIIQNSIAVANALGNKKPNVAAICAVEKVNPKMQATLDAQQLVEMYEKGEITGCVVGGPFGLDNAVSAEAAKHKGINHPVAGNADILLMPMIEAGNVFYKSMMFLAGAKSASVVCGAKKPVILTSRADTFETKLNSIALAALMA